MSMVRNFSNGHYTRRKIMASYNKVILMGNLTRDPEAKQLPSGTPLTEFSLAVNRRWQDASGEQREEVLFIDCSSFGKPAETLAKYLTKGKPIHIEGHLKLDMWEGQDGTKRSKVRVIVEQFRFVDGGRAAADKPASGKNNPSDGPNNDPTPPTPPKRPGGAGRGKRRAPATVGAGAPAADGPGNADIPF
jgi:single-strand DNA-binding protein